MTAPPSITAGYCGVDPKLGYAARLRLPEHKMFRVFVSTAGHAKRADPAAMACHGRASGAGGVAATRIELRAREAGR